jgi:hypothetical protein
MTLMRRELLPNNRKVRESVDESVSRIKGDAATLRERLDAALVANYRQNFSRPHAAELLLEAFGLVYRELVGHDTDQGDVLREYFRFRRGLQRLVPESCRPKFEVESSVPLSLPERERLETILSDLSSVNTPS